MDYNPPGALTPMQSPWSSDKSFQQSLPPSLALGRTAQEPCQLPATNEYSAHADPPTRSDAMSDGDDDIITVVVGTDKVEFEVTRRHLCNASRYFKSILEGTPGIDFPILAPRSGVYTHFQVRRNINQTDFFDFTVYLRTGRVLQYPHNRVKYAVDAAVSRLIAAIRLGISMQSEDYQDTAMQELYLLGPAIEHPERFVNEIFASCGTYRHAVDGDILHPVRWLIVCICATNASCNGLYLSRPPDLTKNARGHVIKAENFWDMYREFVQV